MAVNLSPPDPRQLIGIKGVELGVAKAGIQSGDRTDLVLIRLSWQSRVVTVYTQNAFCAAPVIVAKAHQRMTAPRYLLINSGNANAGTGQAGLDATNRCCEAVAAMFKDKPEAVLPFSTGVIGQPLPVDKIIQSLSHAKQTLAPHRWYDAAHAIMTTDTVAKAVSRQTMIDGRTITVTGMAKGSGMIRPDMATMLAYIATDADVAHDTLATMLNQAVACSFNRITVDGDTSTNDACVLIATGEAGNAPITATDTPAAQQLYSLVLEVCQYLAQAIVRDGEGATKLITVTVTEGLDQTECRQVAYTVAHSPLVKTAFFASDPNWGRILAAVGRSGLDNFDLSQVSIFLDKTAIIVQGEPAPNYTEYQGQQVMNQDEITITVQLGRGDASETVWTCDLSYDYVKINAEYRT